MPVTCGVLLAFPLRWGPSGHILGPTGASSVLGSHAGVRLRCSLRYALGVLHHHGDGLLMRLLCMLLLWRDHLEIGLAGRGVDNLSLQ